MKALGSCVEIVAIKKDLNSRGLNGGVFLESKTATQPSLQEGSGLIKGLWILLSLLAIGGAGLAFFFIFPETKKMIQGQVNMYVLIAGIIFSVSSGLSFLSDLKLFQPYNGLSFENEWLYFYQIFRKMKIKFEDVEEVTFYPSLFSFKGIEERSGWVKVETIGSKYLMFVPRYHQAVVNFERKDIPSNINKSSLPILLVISIAVGAYNLWALLGLFCLIFVVPSNLARNGFMSRRSEIMLLFLCLSLPMMYFSRGPVSEADRWDYSFQEAKANGKEEEMLHLCDEVLDQDHHSILANCSEFYVFSKNPSFRNFAKALKLSSAAMVKTKNKEKLKKYADNLSCAYFGLGQVEFANQVATQYSLSSRLEQFKAGESCSPAVANEPEKSAEPEQ